MHRPLIAAACALALAACGGSESKPANAAAEATFHYGAAAPASAAQAAALEAPVAGAAAFAAAPTADVGLAVSDLGLLTQELLGSSGYAIGAAGPAPSLRALSTAGGPARALSAAGFDDPTCVSTTATSVTFTGCTLTMDQSSPTSTYHAVITANGSLRFTAATATLAWDLTVGETVTVSGSTSGTIGVSVHQSGSQAVTATTIVGHMATEMVASVAANGQSMRIGVDERVDVDVTYADAATCATRVTGGTVEAKRVWTARPQGATAADLPDAAAKITWTGCGQATIQLGTR